MSALRAVLLASLVAGWLVVPVLAMPSVASDGEIRPDARALMAQANNSSEVSVGQQISGFMQQQASQADGAVETGMWSAAYENAADESARAGLVNQRTAELADEVRALQAERRELIAAKQAGEISNLEFRSRMSGLAGQYASLLAAINETDPRAREVGANVTAVEDLRSDAAKAAGPEVAAAAGNAVVSPPGLVDNSTAGPPADTPGQNGTTDAATGSGNAVGNGNGDGNGVGNGDGVGNGIGDENGIGNGFDFSNPPWSGNANFSNPSSVLAVWLPGES